MSYSKMPALIKARLWLISPRWKEKPHCLRQLFLLVQLGENIGTVARAMLNFGLTDLRLVSPRPGWQMERAPKAISRCRLID